MSQSGTERIPLTRLQEAVLHIERAHTPWNMQLEAATTATLDAERLRAAGRTAAATYPMARARLRRTDDDPGYAWVVSDRERPVGPPLEVIDDDAVEFGALRRRFYGTRFDLTSEPPFRLLVVRGGGRDGGDRLCVCVSHVPMDGIAAFRVLQALLVAYADGDPTPATVEASPQQLLERTRSDGVVHRLRRLAATARRAGYLADSPTDIAAEGGPAAPGQWRFAHRHLDAESTGRLVDERPAGVSVNDLLLAALHLTIDEWNGTRGVDTGRISLLMPMNVRPEERFFDGVGLYTLFDSVTTTPKHRRSPARTLRRVAARTDAIVSTDRQFGYLDWWRLVSAMPHAVRRRIADAVFGLGEPFLDTAVLSNLGRIPALPPLADGELVRPWVTPPCWPPTPLSVGAVTVGDRLHVGFRYEADRFDAPATEAFADAYLGRLTGLTESAAD